MNATTYIIGSGGVRKDTAKRHKFLKELIGTITKPRVLVCIFAQPREVWETKFPEYSSWIKEVAPNAECKMAEPHLFEQQLAWADCVYMHGGDNHLIKYWLGKFDIHRLFMGKRIATTSASSNALSTYSYDCDYRTVDEGPWTAAH